MTTRKNETPVAEEIHLPEITRVYDLMSKKQDGTITPQGPVIVSGRYFNMYMQASVRLCLVPTDHPEKVIEVTSVYRHSEGEIFVSIPQMPPGEYSPAIKIFRPGKREAELVVLGDKWRVEK